MTISHAHPFFPCSCSKRASLFRFSGLQNMTRSKIILLVIDAGFDGVERLSKWSQKIQLTVRCGPMFLSLTLRFQSESRKVRRCCGRCASFTTKATSNLKSRPRQLGMVTAWKASSADSQHMLSVYL